MRDFRRPTFLLFIVRLGLCTSGISIFSPCECGRRFLLTEEHRFGAVVAAGIYSLFRGNGVVLSIFGFFFSLPCFYYIVAKPQYAATGRFVLLTYNLTCLYAYVM